MSLSPFMYDDFYRLPPPPPAGTPAPEPIPVTLDFILGAVGQSADYTATLDGTVLYKHEKVSHTNVLLGDASSLGGKTLTINGFIVDMPGTSNELTLDFKITGGVDPLSQSFSATATTGDQVNFSVIVRFA